MQKQQKLDIRLPPDAYAETHNYASAALIVCDLTRRPQIAQYFCPKIDQHCVQGLVLKRLRGSPRSTVKRMDSTPLMHMQLQWHPRKKPGQSPLEFR